MSSTDLLFSYKWRAKKQRPNCFLVRMGAALLGVKKNTIKVLSFIYNLIHFGPVWGLAEL